MPLGAVLPETPLVFGHQHLKCVEISKVWRRNRDSPLPVKAENPSNHNRDNGP